MQLTKLEKLLAFGEKDGAQEVESAADWLRAEMARAKEPAKPRRLLKKPESDLAALQATGESQTLVGDGKAEQQTQSMAATYLYSVLQATDEAKTPVGDDDAEPQTQSNGKVVLV